MAVVDIPFNKPFISGLELDYIKEAVEVNLNTAGNGIFTKKCHQFFEETFGFGKCLLTTSCTDALEMAAILADIQPGDEVIMPAYTFVSTANAFALRGAVIQFVDSCQEHPGMDEKRIEELINSRTKAIVVVHYAGIAVHMDKVCELAKKHKLLLIEDAAQAIDSYYLGENGKKALGTFGQFATFSFHETKNLISGEGGMLVINDRNYGHRAEVIWEKGTNRAAFQRGEVHKYHWLDVGSSFLPSELIAAFLFAQTEHLHEIQKKRISIWEKYQNAFVKSLQNKNVKCSFIPNYATCNGHMYYLVCSNKSERDDLITHLASDGIQAVFHYQALHKSPYINGLNREAQHLQYAELYSDTLIRLPFYFGLSEAEQERVINAVNLFYTEK